MSIYSNPKMQNKRMRASVFGRPFYAGTKFPQAATINPEEITHTHLKVLDSE